MNRSNFCALISIVLGCIVSHHVVSGLKTTINVKESKEKLVMIDMFGFSESTGVYTLNLDSFIVEHGTLCGFIVERSNTRISRMNIDLACEILVNQTVYWPYAEFYGTLPLKEKISYIVKNKGGYYSTYIVNCAGEPLSVTITLEEYNLESDGTPNYIDDGESGVYILNSVFGVAYVALAVVWVLFCFKQKLSNLKPVHHSVSVLLLLRILSLILGAIELSYLAKYGIMENAWTFLHQIVVIIQDVLLYVVVVFIGSGWSVVKANFNKREKVIILMVLIIQMIVQTGAAVHQIISRSILMYPFLVAIFRGSDLLCCVAVMLPIMWSIRHLENCADIDDKVSLNLTRLRTFREFYVAFIVFLYSRLVLSFFLQLTIECPDAWISSTFDEFLYLFFFGLIAWKLRPSKDNPYMQLGVSLSASINATDQSVPMALMDGSSNGTDKEENEEAERQHLRSAERSFLSFVPLAVPVSPAASTVKEFLTASAANSFSSLAR